MHDNVIGVSAVSPTWWSTHRISVSVCLSVCLSICCFWIDNCHIRCWAPAIPYTYTKLSFVLLFCMSLCCRRWPVENQSRQNTLHRRNTREFEILAEPGEEGGYSCLKLPFKDNASILTLIRLHYRANLWDKVNVESTSLTDRACCQQSNPAA